MIEKTEYPSDGAPIIKDTIFIQNTMATKAKDSAVKYGTRYGYKIRSIVKAKILVEDNDPKTNNFYVLEFLFASKAYFFLFLIKSIIFFTITELLFAIIGKLLLTLLIPLNPIFEVMTGTP